MTPKEEASELVEKMYAQASPDNGMGYYEAIDCAKVAVDKILNILGEVYNDAIPCPEDYNGEMIMRDYFEQVKTEIENHER